MLFYTIWLRKENRRKKKWKKVFPPRPTFFILSNWEENEERKVMKNAFYTNTLTLLHSPTSLTFPLLCNKNIIVNLHKLHFPSSPFSLQPNKKVFHPPTFSPLQPNTQEGKLNISILPLFHSFIQTDPSGNSIRKERNFEKKKQAFGASLQSLL